MKKITVLCCLTVLLTLPRTALATCEPHPVAELTKTGERVTTSSITGQTQREYELTLKAETHIACASDINCESNIVINVGTGIFWNVAGYALCDSDGESQISTTDDGASACARRVSGAGDVSVTHTVTVKPGARYVANYRGNSRFASDCDLNEMVWGWANRCGHTNIIDLPPIIEDGLLYGIDLSDPENIFFGPTSGLVVGKSARVTLNASTPNADTTLVRTWHIQGPGIDIRQEFSSGSGNSVTFEDIVPMQEGALTATLTVSGRLWLYDENSGCNSTEGEPWSLTSAPFVINVGKTPCPLSDTAQLYIPSNATCTPQEEVSEPKGDDESDSSGCSTTGGASFTLMGLLPALALRLRRTLAIRERSPASHALTS